MKFAVLFLQELLTMGPLPRGEAWALDLVLCLGLKSSSSLKICVRRKWLISESQIPAWRLGMRMQSVPAASLGCYKDEKEYVYSVEALGTYSCSIVAGSLPSLLR